jgi:uncharacterized coiled-coil protein SlyX
MEEYFYEFWKNQIITVEKGQKQMQDVTKLIFQGLGGFEEVPEMFGKFCSIDFWSKETCDYIKAWEMTREDFHKFFKDYLNLMGLVPKHEHLTLINKYNDLNQSVIDQKKEIADQKKLLADQKKEITRQKKVVTDQKKEISKQKALVVDQNKLLTDLKKKISDKKKAAADQNEEIANQKKRIAYLEKEIAGQIKSIKQLQSQVRG